MVTGTMMENFCGDDTKNMLNDLKWETLETGVVCCGLTMFYRMQQQHCTLPASGTQSGTLFSFKAGISDYYGH